MSRDGGLAAPRDLTPGHPATTHASDNPALSAPPSRLSRLILILILCFGGVPRPPLQVFFSSCNSVKFHSELLNYIDIPVMDIHGRQKQQKRTTSFFQFCKQVL